jgi:hypothetical protein
MTTRKIANADLHRSKPVEERGKASFGASLSGRQQFGREHGARFGVLNGQSRSDRPQH